MSEDLDNRSKLIDLRSRASFEDAMYHVQLVFFHEYHLEKLIPSYKRGHDAFQTKIYEQIAILDDGKPHGLLEAVPRFYKDETFEKTVGQCPICQKYLKEDGEKQ